MEIGLSKHPLIEDLYIVEYGDMKVYFNNVSYDHSEDCIIFEREDEVVTGRLSVIEQQLQIWKSALENMGVELEYLID
ncbi:MULTISPECIES: hypothetical protein [Vibrio]|uniref:hypothetical protein n=1 Tax=Vibrio TaxID=662 RepID=UPI001A2989BF|nr:MULTISPECIES: hypothetical protein [Vibrio]HAS8209852.1 hypothetical protein [Vibrio vulnificus]MBO1367255.1 hypothetical protein [Vibrio cholerae]MBO1371311.1 hypothetical protein [Vibrio cholerae]MBO1374151.1 hypothetical protein [Vibrio cholerae]MBO1378587.1 hypothetical protein [Vibrio cholerae]